MADDSAPSRSRRPASRVGALSRRLAEGISVPFLVALGALVLIAILFTVATRKAHEPRGYAALILFPDSCLIDQTRQTGTVGCEIVAPRTYRIGFVRSLKGTAPVVSRGSCCAGGAGVSVVSDHAIVLVISGRVRGPISASVLIP
jgi:hypothetical protein